MSRDPSRNPPALAVGRFKTIKVCTACGSPRVLADAWVGVNDPDNVTTFDATFCEDCEDDCNVVEVDVADSFNIETDFAEVQNGTLPC